MSKKKAKQAIPEDEPTGVVRDKPKFCVLVGGHVSERFDCEGCVKCEEEG